MKLDKKKIQYNSKDNVLKIIYFIKFTINMSNIKCECNSKKIIICEHYELIIEQNECSYLIFFL